MILAIQTDEVNFETAEVHIHRTLIYTKGTVTLRPTTKTKSSYRTVKVSKTTIEALKALKTTGQAPSGYLFTQHGKPWSRHNFDGAWGRLLVQAGVPHYGFHSTRHTCATRLLRAGHYITSVSKRLGHSKPSMTLDLYSNVIPSDDSVLASAFDSHMVAIALARSEKAA